MVRNINHNIMTLGIAAEPATEADRQVGQDLLDTLQAHTAECVGMAANMIGINKAIIVVNMGMVNVLMYNPVITAQSEAYETQEGCLSLQGQRPCTRYQKITVEYQDHNFQKQTGEFLGWIAEIIQHEIDHTKGIII